MRTAALRLTRPHPRTSRPYALQSSRLVLLTPSTRSFSHSLLNSPTAKSPKTDADQKTLEVKPEQQSEPARFSEKTPLLGELQERIRLRGAITVHDYMTSCLTHPVHGYYSTQEALGKIGDFTTAPEISQTFGEMIAVWCVASWQKMGEPQRIHLVEIGGGKGTLMKDVLRACSNFAKFSRALSRITMVDASARMRKLQREALGCTPVSGKVEENESGDGEYLLRYPFNRTSRGGSVRMRWVNTLSEVESQGEPVLVIAQELFDALPVHQFQYSDGRWCERLVDVADDPKESGPPDLQNLQHHLRFVLSRGPTPAAKILLGGAILRPAAEGAQIEIGTSAAALAQDLAIMIKNSTRGSALIIDYGENHPIADSLRGIKNHEFVHPLREPGLVDLSVDVDFNSLRKAVRDGLKALKITPPSVIGPITQAEFLKNMGIEYRVAALLKLKETEEEQLEIFMGYQRLVEDMGTAYKVMVITSEMETPGFTKLPDIASTNANGGTGGP